VEGEEEDEAGPLVRVANPLVALEAEGAGNGGGAAAARAPEFPPVGPEALRGGKAGKVEFRRIPVPPHRFTPLREHWPELFKPVTEHLKLDMRMNLKTRRVEVKTTKETRDAGALQKAADFVHAFLLGFEVRDAIALLRLDDLFVECFEVKDVKTLRGEHLSRCIGRLSGKEGRTKHSVENATRTRIVVADTHIRILGSFQSIRMARNALCALIMGSPAGKVYSKLRTVAARANERF